MQCTMYVTMPITCIVRIDGSSLCLSVDVRLRSFALLVSGGDSASYLTLVLSGVTVVVVVLVVVLVVVAVGSRVLFRRAQ